MIDRYLLGINSLADLIRYPQGRVLHRTVTAG